MIGSYAKLTFVDFVQNLTVICVICLVVTIVYFVYWYKKEYLKAEVGDIPKDDRAAAGGIQDHQ